MMRKLPWLVGAAFVVASTAYLATAFEWRGVWAILVGADLVWLVGVAGAALLAFIHLRALRWRLLLAQSGIAISYGSAYMATALALSLAIATPLQSGELTKVELLRRTDDVARLPGYGTILVERVLDLGCVLLLGVLSLLTGVELIPNQRRLVAACLLLATLLVAALFVAMRMEPPAALRRLQESVRECLRTPGIIFSTGMLTLLSWLLVATSWHSALRSVGIVLGVTPTLGLMSIVTVVNLVSLVPGALGVSEVSTAIMLRSFGTPAAVASAGALAIRAYAILVLVLGLLHLAVWVRYVRHRRRAPE